MMYRLVATLIFVTATNSVALAMTVQLAGTDPPGLPEASCVNDGQTPCQILLQLVNDADAEAHVVSWQLDLALVAEAGSQGGLTFQDLGAPPDPLFGTDPGPIPLLLTDSNLQAIDADQESISGQPVFPDTPRNILQLVLHLEPATLGTFSLHMLNYDPADDSGSSWFDGDLFLPQAFGNPLSTLPDHLFVGTLTIVSVPEPASAALLLLGGLLLRTLVTAHGRLPGTRRRKSLR